MAAGTAPETRMDGNQNFDRWRIQSGRWAVESQQEGPVLIQRGKTDAFNVIVAPFDRYTDLEAAVKFKPISGREDASGGIIFRFDQGRYYVIRANALEDNFRLYTYGRSRQMVATAHIKPPTLGAWHTLRVTAIGDHIQGYLNGELLIDHRDKNFAAGQVGLWTKADSVTAFTGFTVRGLSQEK